MKTTHNFFLLTTIFFFIIFGWKINNFLDISVLSCLPFYLFFLKTPSKYTETIKSSLIFSSALTATIIYTIVIYYIHPDSSQQWILRTLRASITFGAIFILVRNEILKNKKNGHDTLIYSTILAITTHAAIVIATQLSEDLRHTIYGITNASLYVNEMTLIMDNRPLGLTYSLSITSFLYFIAVSIIISRPAKSHTQKILNIAAITINTIACIWTARTGLVFFPLIIILLTYNFYKSGRNIIDKKNAVAVFCGLAFVATAIWIAISYDARQLSTQMVRIGDLLVFLTSPFESSFGQQYLTMWHIPNEWTQLIIGNSQTGREPGHYVTSDVGYILTIYGTGTIGQMLMLMPVLFGIFYSIKIYKNEKDYSILATLILFSYLVVNVKELALLTRTVWPVICLFISISAIKYQQQRNRLDEDRNSQKPI